MSRFLQVAVKFEPVFAAGTVQAVIALVVALGHNFTAVQTGAIEAVAAAVLALIVALSVHEVTPALYTGLSTAIGTLLATFAVPHITPGLVSAVNGGLTLILMSLLREKVTPVAKAQLEAPALR